MKWPCALGLALLLWCSTASAGPPYATDDPEPVDYQHFELYLGSQSFHDNDGWTGTAPHLEVNYGPVPNVQLAFIAPLAYSVPNNGASTYGYGDTELGVKLRFIQERKWLPMIAVYPLFEVPSGSRAAGLGNGSAQLFLPLWLQKSFGPWQTHGGLGLWLDLGAGDRSWWYFGWQLQRRICDWLTLGAEVFYQGPRQPRGDGDLRFNLGAVVDLTDVHHLVLSAGRGFAGPNLFQAYVAYELAFGWNDDAAR
jgi:hypothetical protein